MGAAEVQGIGTVALVDLVEHGVEAFVLVVGVEQAARDLAVLGEVEQGDADLEDGGCLLYTSPSPRDKRQSRMPSSA